MKTEAIRVIIADDHKMIRETWRLLLSDLPNIDVIAECTSGAEAMTMVPELLPDVVLMDINMSPVNGFEATRKLTRICPKVAIIGISINNQVGYARNILQLGAKGYVTKNSSKEEMVKAIEEVCQGKTYICEEVRQKMKDNQ
jgi:two-component system invasion response regulator UvrY